MKKQCNMEKAGNYTQFSHHQPECLDRHTNSLFWGMFCKVTPAEMVLVPNKNS